MAGTARLTPDVDALVRASTGADVIADTEVVQRLWSGYGEIVRCDLRGATVSTVIVKHVRWPDDPQHPRGWSTDRSHQRKVQSYRVETAWYEHGAERCGEHSRVPAHIASASYPNGVAIVLEDLDAAGFAGRRQRVCESELDACIQWLAVFHATHLGVAPEGLWPTGTYWHLDTRPDEFAAMHDGPLKRKAGRLDQQLRASRFQTVVHGDAKLANFCFSADGARVAAVDFQYVGGGCGMRDVAYFIGSCLDAEQCEQQAPGLLDRYFERLRAEIATTGRDVGSDALEAEWRDLYSVAWADFARFLEGWSPGHWKLHGYSDQRVAEALARS
ncbi:MAG: phosphotransferase [Actinomycetota bacterium]